MNKFITVNIDPASREDHSVLSAASLNWACSSQSTKVTRVSSIPGKNTRFIPVLYHLFQYKTSCSTLANL